MISTSRTLFQRHFLKVTHVPIAKDTYRIGVCEHKPGRNPGIHREFMDYISPRRRGINIYKLSAKELRTALLKYMDHQKLMKLLIENKTLKYETIGPTKNDIIAYIHDEIISKTAPRHMNEAYEFLPFVYQLISDIHSTSADNVSIDLLWASGKHENMEVFIKQVISYLEIDYLLKKRKDSGVEYTKITSKQLLNSTIVLVIKFYIQLYKMCET